MKFISDLHIHSHYSMATSGKLIPEFLEYWARLKGINVVGTGDCIHPGWQQELAEKLEPAGNGFFRLKEAYRLEESKRLKHENIPDEVFFVLTGEISSIYKRDGRVRKVHNITVFPDMESLLKVQRRLDSIGNIRSDGRPILGLDSRVILEMVLESSDRSFLIPAHIWTPWFSVLGSKSGFDTIEECYGALTEHIFAVETGLSSDPPMNWTCSFLDRFRLVSNSDAHSPEKLGREANLFDAELSYEGMYNALKTDTGFTGTIEFYPQEGKYHYDGHRNCGISWNPLETARHGGICPVCRKEVTRGVMYRVAELGDRPASSALQKKEFHSITQLPDLIAEIMKQKSSASKSVASEYLRIISLLGSEFNLYIRSGIDEISRVGGELLGEGVRRLRNGEIYVTEGYDGEFGRIRVFKEGEIDSFRYSSMFDNELTPSGSCITHTQEFNPHEFQTLLASQKPDSFSETFVPEETLPENVLSVHGLTAEQLQCVTFRGSPCIVIAGPGTGKTKVLAGKVKYLVDEGLALPAEIAALTFSNRAAEEMRVRIGSGIISGGTTVSTIHAYGLEMIKSDPGMFNLRDGFNILSDEEKSEIVESLNAGVHTGSIVKEISGFKQGMIINIDTLIINKYTEQLRSRNLIDIDDLVFIPAEFFRENPSMVKVFTGGLKYLMVDEFQDINPAQYSLIKSIVNHGGCELFAIGDPDQSIYGFRGSDIKLIEGAENDFSGIRRFTLTKSFRCPDVILKAAGDILEKGKPLKGFSAGVKITVSESQSGSSEADWIASEIENMMGGVRSFSIESGITDGSQNSRTFGDFAVLCRASFMFDPIVKALNDHGIPCQLIDNEPFYMKEPYKSALTLLKESIALINASASPSDAELAEMISSRENTGSLLVFLLGRSGAEYDAERVIRYFGGIRDYSELHDLYRLRNAGDDYLPDYEAVPVMTIHAAKGLEFNTVFIPGCEDGIIPFNLFGETDYDEEKRILYVGFTRASENLFLSYASKRFFRGRVLTSKGSRFLDRISKDLIFKRKREPERQKKDDKQLDLF